MSDLIVNLQNIYATKLQIKDAIGTDSDIFADYPSYISDLKPAGYTYITTNGDHNVNAYSYVNVNVPQGGAAVLGNLSVTENGQYSASSYAYDGFDVVNVNVPQPTLGSVTINANGIYSASDFGYNGLSGAVVNVPVPTGYIIPTGTYTATSNGVHDITSYSNVDVQVSSGSSHSGDSVEDAWSVDEAVAYIQNAGSEAVTANKYVKGFVSQVEYTFSAQYPTCRVYIKDDPDNPGAQLYLRNFYSEDVFRGGLSAWDADTCKQIQVGDFIVAQGTQYVYYQSTTPQMSQGNLLYHKKTATGQLTITQSGTYDVQGYVSVVVDLTPAPAYITNIQYSTGNNDGGILQQIGDIWTDMTEDPVTGVFSTPASDSTHYNGNNYGGYIGFRAVYSDNSYTYLNVPHGYNNSIRSDTSGVCTEENALVCFSWNDTFTTDWIDINKNDLYFSVNRNPWILTSYKCSYDSSTGDYTVIDSNATPATISNMGAKLSGFENSYYYKFVCTAQGGRIIQDNILATEQITLQDSDYTVTLDTAGTYYVTFNSTQLDDKMLSVSFSGAESFNSISAQWQPAPFIRISYTSGGTSQSLKLKGDVAGTLTIDSQQVISVYDKNGERWISSDGATCDSSSSGQSISLTQDMEMTAQNSNVTFDAGQYSITPAISGDSFMIYSVGLTVSYLGANS